MATTNPAALFSVLSPVRTSGSDLWSISSHCMRPCAMPLMMISHSWPSVYFATLFSLCLHFLTNLCVKMCWSLKRTGYNQLILSPKARFNNKPPQKSTVPAKTRFCPQAWLSSDQNAAFPISLVTAELITVARLQSRDTWAIWMLWIQWGESPGRPHQRSGLHGAGAGRHRQVEGVRLPGSPLPSTIHS